MMSLWRKGKLSQKTFPYYLDYEQPDGRGGRCVALRAYYIFRWLVINHIVEANLVDHGMHTHPSDAFSIIFSGGYEQDVERFGKVRHEFVNWFNWLGRNTFHKVTKVKSNTWTLFIMNPFRYRKKIFARVGDQVFEKDLKE